MTESDPGPDAAFRDEDVAHVREPCTVPASTREGKPVVLARQRLRVGQVDEAVLVEIRVQGDVHIAVNGARHS